MAEINMQFVHKVNKSEIPVCNIMGVNIAAIDMNWLLKFTEKYITDLSGDYCCVSNVHTTVTSWEDKDYCMIQNGGILAIPDGGPLSSVGKRRGYTKMKRTTGPAYMEEIFKISAQKGELEYPKEFLGLSQNITKILTVGRLEEQKGYDIALSVCKNLVEENLKIEWFVLGEGTLKEKLKSESKKLGIEKYFHFVGVKMNPYPYFKNCDIYVQTSKHEGYCTTITEAKVFYRPIVTTDVAGVREQIRDGVSGDISKISVNSVDENLKRLIKDKKRQEQYIEELKKEIILDSPEWLEIFR